MKRPVNLALHYMRGQGVPKNYIVSLMWGLIADVNATEIGCLARLTRWTFCR